MVKAVSHSIPLKIECFLPGFCQLLLRAFSGAFGKGKLRVALVLSVPYWLFVVYWGG